MDEAGFGCAEKFQGEAVIKAYVMKVFGALPDEFYRDLLLGSEIVRIDADIYSYMRNRFSEKILFELRDRFAIKLYTSAEKIVWTEFFIEGGEFFMKPACCDLK